MLCDIAGIPMWSKVGGGKWRAGGGRARYRRVGWVGRGHVEQRGSSASGLVRFGAKAALRRVSVLHRM